MRRILYLALAFLAGSLLATALVNAAPIHDSFEAYLPTPYRFELPGGANPADAGENFTQPWAVSDAVRALVNGVHADMGYIGGDVAIHGGNVAMQLGPDGPSGTSVYTAAYVAPISGEDIWFSLLFETAAATGAAERDFFQLMFTTQAEGATNDTLSLVMDQVGSAHEFIARAGGSTSSGTGNNVSTGFANTPGTPTFLVGCLKPDASGAYNAIDLYANPTSIAQPQTADASASFAIANPLKSIDKIYTRTSAWETNDSVLVDELRLGKTYQDVLAVYENAVRADDPAVYFRFNGADSDKSSLEAYDLMQGMVGVGTGAAGTPQPDMNVDGPQTGMFESDNSAVAFAGVDTRLKGYDPGTDSALDFDTGDTITMEAWVKVDVLRPARIAISSPRAAMKNPTCRITACEFRTPPAMPAH